eukprot:1161015-Pelagomonas_calceolata.AAC.7
MSLPHQKVRGKLMWVWWVSGSTQPQGSRIIMSVFDFNGTSGRGNFARTLHRVGMELSCKFGRPSRVNPWFLKLIQGVGSKDSSFHTQEDYVESGLGTLKLLAQFTVLLLCGFQLGIRPSIFAVFDFYKVNMAVLDVQFMMLPGWSCAAPDLFVTSHTMEYLM